MKYPVRQTMYIQGNQCILYFIMQSYFAFSWYVIQSCICNIYFQLCYFILTLHILVLCYAIYLGKYSKMNVCLSAIVHGCGICPFISNFIGIKWNIVMNLFGLRLYVFYSVLQWRKMQNNIYTHLITHKLCRNQFMHFKNSGHFEISSHMIKRSHDPSGLDIISLHPLLSKLIHLNPCADHPFLKIDIRWNFSAL